MLDRNISVIPPHDKGYFFLILPLCIQRLTEEVIDESSVVSFVLNIPCSVFGITHCVSGIVCRALYVGHFFLS